MLNQFYLRNKNALFSPGAGQGNFIAICCLSFIMHGLFFCGIFWLYDFDLSKPLPRVLRVDLVSFVPGPAGGQGEVDPALTDPSAPPESVDVTDADKIPLDPATKPIADSVKTAPKPLETLKPDISLKKKPKNLKELMAAREKKEKKKPIKKPPPRLKPKSKVDPEEALKKAREKLAEKIEKQDKKQISDALSRLQTSIDAKSDQNQGMGPGAGNATGLGKQRYKPIDMYNIALQHAIEQNWVFNDMLARMDQHLEVRVMIKILKTGEIRDIAYETKSGNRYLDESAKNAIRKANPLPVLPQGMNSYDVVVIFTPKGLK